jgi:hypothetical protein
MRSSQRFIFIATIVIKLTYCFQIGFFAPSLNRAVSSASRRHDRPDSEQSMRNTPLIELQRGIPPLFVVRISEANRVIRKGGKNFEYNSKNMHIPHRKRVALNDILPKVQRPVVNAAERKDLSELKIGDRVKGRVVSIKP